MGHSLTKRCRVGVGRGALTPTSVWIIHETGLLSTVTRSSAAGPAHKVLDPTKHQSDLTPLNSVNE